MAGVDGVETRGTCHLRSQTADQLTGRRGRPLIAQTSSGQGCWRLGLGTPQGARGGWEPFQQLWLFLQEIYQTLQYKTKA